MPKNNKVAIIVLNYNNPVASIRCLNSLKLLLDGETSFTTILVDNGSTDNSVSQILLNFPELDIIRSKKNLGFAGGNNLGIKKAMKDKADSIILLNNDTQIIDGEMLDKLLATEADLTSPRLKFHRNNLTYIDYGGKVDSLFGRNTHFESRDNDLPKHTPQPDYLSGTCLLIRKKVFDKVGLLDPGYFLYYEDADFCLRAKRAGFQLEVCPDTAIYHQLSNSSDKLGKKKIQILANSHLRFTLKNLSPVVWPLALSFNFYLRLKTF